MTDGDERNDGNERNRGSTDIREDMQESLDFLRKEIQDIKGQMHDLVPQKMDSWERVKIFIPIISAVLVAAIGWYATHSITGAIDRKRLELSHLVAMNELMAKLRDPSLERAEAEATGAMIGSFGSYAVIPLLSELKMGGSNRQFAAREGLRVAAFKDPEKTSALLIEVLERRFALFNVQMHREVVRILGEMDCHEAVPFLQEFRELLSTKSGIELYKKMIRQMPPPDVKAIRALQREIEGALENIQT